MLRDREKLPAWLANLVSAEIAMAGIPSAASAPAVWPETGGRGFLLSEPGRRPVGNAETLRFMAPRVSVGDQSRYLRYTDPAGDYVDPWTGSTRGPAPTTLPVTDTAVSHRPLSERPPAQPWTWPASEIRPVDVSSIERVIAGRQLAGVQVDETGGRFVLDHGHGAEPAVYIDCVRPQLWLSSSGERVAEVDRELLIAAETVGDVRADGALEIMLSTGLSLRCAAEQHFEAWQLVSQDAGLWISLPGGEIAEFSFRADSGT